MDWAMRKAGRIPKPGEGWLVLLLLVGATLCLVKSLLDAEWVAGDSAFLGLALAALLWGMVLAKLPFPGWLSLAAGLMTGIEVCYIMAAQATPRLGNLWLEAERAWPWLTQVRYGYIEMPVPFFQPLYEAYSRAVGLLYRILWWYQAGAAGKESRDEVVFWLILAVLVWGVSFFASWRLFRSRRVMQAVLPLGFLLVSNAFYVSQGLGYIIAMLACILLLMLQVHFVRLHAFWDRKGIAYSDQIYHETLVVGAVVIALAMLWAFFLPVLTSSRTHHAFWRRFGRTWGRVEAAMTRLLVDRAPSGSLISTGPAGGGVPGMPEHELGGPVLPGKDVVMHVWTSDIVDLELLDIEYGGPFEIPKRYWRAGTYDRYTTRGWQSSQFGLGEIGAGQPLVVEKDPKKVVRVAQEYTVFKSNGLLFAVNEPLSVDKHVSVQYRGGWDFASALISADRYMVHSQVVKATVRELRNASTRYPEWVEEYLELPSGVPDRVRKLAQEVTRGAETPYDKAQAIEAYLRTFDYSTDVPEAPAGRDVADYFLFDLKKGYCDHFSTAMVVMARSVKVPARHAVGYASGTLDIVLERYVVRDDDAHAWVEVYFPGYGWVEFEPTANRSRFDRWLGPGGSEDFGRQDIGRIGRTTELHLDVESVGKVILGLVAVLAFWALWRLRGERIGRLPPRDFARAAYALLCRHSERLGLGPRDWQTPLEYTRLLSGRLEARGRLVPVFNRWPHWEEGELARDVERLSSAYVRALYSPHPVSEGEKEILDESWRRLRRRLLFMRLRRKK